MTAQLFCYWTDRKIRPEWVIGDRARVQIIWFKRGGINRFSKKHVISNPIHVSGFEAYHGTGVSCECCVLSGRGVCDGPITRPEESYRVWCV